MKSDLRLKEISHLDSHRGRYVVASDTPDNGRSVYAECWGSMAKYRRRAVFASDSLGEAVSMADEHATIMDRSTGRPVGKEKLGSNT